MATAAVVAQAVALGHLIASAMPGARPLDRPGWFAVLAAGVGARAMCALAGELSASRAAVSAKAVLRARLVAAALSTAPLGHGGPALARSGGRGSDGPGTTGPGPTFAAGDMAALAGRGLDAIDVYVGRCLPDMVLAAASPLALLCAAGVLDWVSALVMTVVVALFPVFGALVGRSSLDLAAKRWSQLEQLGRQVADLFQGLPVLKAFGRTPEQRARLAAANETLRCSTSGTLRVAFLSALVLDTLASVSVALVAVPLGLRLITGGVGLAPALAVLIIAPEVFLPLRRASA
ncbi:MAG TPA: ABC transporter transmembrane domain-containing protein, partial [Acidimicrobiales bacterium]|nr:ABC transporter transmembrane domain-containing protein [Acidimicrobiales bacterium]